MLFRTEIKATKSEIQLEPYEPVMMTGSCFAENIVLRMHRTLWGAYNPFGMLYNPLSIFSVLKNLLIREENEALTAFEKSAFQSGGIFYSWMFDSRMHGKSIEELVAKYKDLRKDVGDFMETCDTMFVTFGTSWCYALADHGTYDAMTENAVSNCHKQPAGLFRRFRLTPDRITGCWSDLIHGLRMKHPGLRFVFTVSPVRHLKDGIHENTLSKAILHLAIEQLCLEESECFYFPAFELLNDDLRDYRFYAEDMAHPSDRAVEYIWEHFQQTFMSESTRRVVAEGEKLYKRLNHRPITGIPDPAFLKETDRLLSEFRQKYPRAGLQP